MAKKMEAKKAAAKKFKVPPATRPRTKGQIFGILAEHSELSRKQVAQVFEGMAGLIQNDLSKKGPGAFTVPGLIKLRVVRKPAVKARMGVNPFTKEQMMFKAKPARNAVRATALKNLKDKVN